MPRGGRAFGPPLSFLFSFLGLSSFALHCCRIALEEILDDGGRASNVVGRPAMRGTCSVGTPISASASLQPAIRLEARTDVRSSRSCSVSPLTGTLRPRPGWRHRTTEHIVTAPGHRVILLRRAKLWVGQTGCPYRRVTWSCSLRGGQAALAGLAVRRSAPPCRTNWTRRCCTGLTKLDILADGTFLWGCCGSLLAVRMCPRPELSLSKEFYTLRGVAR